MTLVQDGAPALNNVSDNTQLEDYIQRMYSETREFVEAHPLGSAAGEGE